MDFPKHKGSMTLEHNGHRDSYCSAKEAIEIDGASCREFRWKDQESRQRAIDTDEIWHMHWYPDTPVGSCSATAPTLAELMEFANEEEAA